MARRCRLGGALNAVFDGIQHKLSKVLWMDDPFAKPPVNYNPIGFVGNHVIQEPIPIIQGSYKRLLPNLAKVQIYKQA